MNPSPRRSLRRAPISAVAALVAAGALAAAGPASAAPATDGTSNTVQFAVTSATLDQLQHRVLAITPTRPDLPAGTHLASLQLNGPHMSFILTDVMIESVTATNSPAPGSTRINVKYTLFLPG